MRESDAPAASQLHPAPCRPFRRALIASIIAAAAVAASLAVGRIPVFQEGGPAEIVQLVLWIGAALFAFLLVVPMRTISDRAAMALVGLAAAAAAAREIDAHILLNPETIGDLGVRYRIDWWLDDEVSLLRKLVWAALAAAGVAAVVAATIAAHIHPLLAIKRRSRTLVYFAAAALCLAIGFTFDDLLRGRLPLSKAQALEESVEVLAPLFYLAAANHLAVVSLAARRSTPKPHATDTLDPCPQQPPHNQTSSPSQRSTSTASPNASQDSTTSTRPASAIASAPLSRP